MSRPSVLIVEPDTSRRRELGRRLAELGYEAVPAMSVEEGLRFAAGLGPAVIVAAAELVEGEAMDELARANRRGSLVLLGRPRRPETEVPEEVMWIPTDTGNGPGSLPMAKLELVLLGREIGVEPDTGLEALVGDLALHPPLELIRALARAVFTGRLVTEDGRLLLHRGEVMAAYVGRVRGIKAFCRLGRMLEGPFRVEPEEAPPEDVEREIEEEVDSLVIRAVEDASIGELPHPRTRLGVGTGSASPAGELTRLQRRILTAARRGTTVGALLDALPQTDGTVLEDLLALQSQGVLVFREPQTRVRIVTDSTADLPRDLCRRLGIEVVPLGVNFGDRRFVDGRDLGARRFYELLTEKGSPHPSTEPPAAADFEGVYQTLLEQRDVVSLHISSKLSETFAHAHQAAAESLRRAPDRPEGEGPVSLEVLDTRQVSLGLGLLAVFAARMALRGEGAAAILEGCRSMAERFQVLFVVNTLEYLARGGRIGKARALVGELLRIKPILGLVNGEVVPVDRVRGGRAAHPRILELLGERLDPQRPVMVGVAHADAPVWADRLAKLIRGRFPVRELLQTEIGPVVGAHAGPGTVGAVAFQPTEEELLLIAPLGEEPEGFEV